MAPAVSIIIPVYNAEKTLRRCLDSVLNQSFADFEVLAVDDGSRDGSPAICDEFAARDPRVRVFHRENAGVSAARNLALAQAEGEFLQFLDSDDWLTPDATELLVRTARDRGCDLVISDFYRVVGDRVSRKGDIGEDAVLTREQYAAHMMDNPADFYYGVLWNKLYRRDIVAKHHLEMDPAVSWCEDFMFNLEYIRRAETFCALQVPVYYYVKTKGSLANQSLSFPKSIQTKLTIFAYYDHFLRSVFDEEDYEKSRLKICRFLIDAAGDGAVPPLPLPGSRKLGEERLSVCPRSLEDEGPLADAFRERKLLERCLEPTALKYDLTLTDARLLLAIRREEPWRSRKDLADFLGVSRSALALSLQRLGSRDLLEAEDLREEPVRGGRRPFRVRPLPEAEPILAELRAAEQDCRRARVAGFTDEELAQFAYLSSRIRNNIRRRLS